MCIQTACDFAKGSNGQSTSKLVAHYFFYHHILSWQTPPLLSARGLGMRIVGGKTGADGRLFAYVVWTVPGGVAEKCGLQQGDKVPINLFLEYNKRMYS